MLVWRQKHKHYYFLWEDLMLWCTMPASFVEFIHTHKHTLNPVLSVNQYLWICIPFFYYSTACNCLCILQGCKPGIRGLLILNEWYLRLEVLIDFGFLIVKSKQGSNKWCSHSKMSYSKDCCLFLCLYTLDAYIPLLSLSSLFSHRFFPLLLSQCLWIEI